MSTDYSLTLTLDAVDNTSETLKTLGSNVDGINNKLDTISTKSTTSSKDMVLGFTNIANAGLNLYNGFDRVTQAQTSLDKANVTVKKGIETLETAQDNYNEAVRKYGSDSAEAKDAMDKLTIAQDSLKVAQERAGQAQENLTKSMISAAVTAIPGIIGMVGSFSTITKNSSGIVEGLSGALSFLSANPIVLVLLGIGLLVTALIAAYENCKPFRDAVNEIGGILAGAFTTAWNAISGVIIGFKDNVLVPIQAALNAIWNDVLVPLGSFIVDVFVANWTTLSTLWNDVILPAINGVKDALNLVWNDVLKPIGEFVCGGLLTAWNTFASGIQTLYDTLIKPVIQALTDAYNNVLKPVGDFFSGVGNTLGGVGKAIGGGLGAIGSFLGFQQGGVVTRPTLALVGEAGPEAIVPLGQGLGGGNVYIYNIIQGSADEKTVRLLTEKLKNVRVESSSFGASSTHKQIRFGTAISSKTAISRNVNRF